MDSVTSSISRKKMPEGWNPPAPAFAADFSAKPGTMVMAYFGTQVRSGGHDHYRTINGFMKAADAPGNVEYAKSIDRKGIETIITAAYWPNPEAFEKWEASSGFSKWWNDSARLREPNGYFFEVLKVPTDRFETIFSTQHLKDMIGVARITDRVNGPVREHNYWGSMRDRITKSESDDFVSPYGTTMPHLGAKETANKRIRVKVPENLAVIRSGQDWIDCRGAELASYDESIRPKLTEGMMFPRDNPDAAGCCDLRFARETDAAGNEIKRSFGFGYFLTLGHLEHWAESHPTHLAIFRNFIAMLQQYQFKVDLRLWHEVSVLPAGHVFEYINCHPDTGVLPYFPAIE